MEKRAFAGDARHIIENSRANNLAQGDLPLYSELNSGSPIPIFWLVAWKAVKSHKESAPIVSISAESRPRRRRQQTVRLSTSCRSLSHLGARACKLAICLLRIYAIPPSESYTFANRTPRPRHGGAALETRTARRTIASHSEDVQRCAYRHLLYFTALTRLPCGRRSSPGIVGPRRSGCAHRVESAFAHFRWCVQDGGSREQEELDEVLIILPSDLQALTRGPRSVSRLPVTVCLPCLEDPSQQVLMPTPHKAISTTPSSCSRSFPPNSLGVRPSDPPRFSCSSSSRTGPADLRMPLAVGLIYVIMSCLLLLIAQFRRRRSDHDFSGELA